MNTAIRPTRKAGSLWWAMNNCRLQVDGEWQQFTIYEEPWLFPFLADVYWAVNDMAKGKVRKIVAKKGTQIAFTTLLFNALWYFLDMFYENAMYMLPDQGQLGDVAHNRLDRIIQNSPYLDAMFTDISNVGLKVARNSGLYLRGANSKSKLEEVPVGFLVRDELNRMDKDNRELALERLGGSSHGWVIDASHPTFPGEGISLEYDKSSRHEWWFPCPHCGLGQTIRWEEQVDIEENCLRCVGCGGELKKEDLWKGCYRSDDPDNPVRGFWIPQVLSPSPEASLDIIIAKWIAAQDNARALQIFHNSQLGLDYAIGGEKLTTVLVRNRMIGSPMIDYGNVEAMGIDVGAVLHFWLQDKETVVKVGKVSEWEGLDLYVSKHHPKCVVIDADPEYHEARNYMEKLRKLGVDTWLCDRVGGRAAGDDIDRENHIYSVNMVNQLDEFMGGFNSLVLPCDLPEEAINHLCAPTRLLRDTKHGTEGMWEKGTCHYADAACYAMAARKLIKQMGPVIAGPGGVTQQSKWASLGVRRRA